MARRKTSKKKTAAKPQLKSGSKQGWFAWAACTISHLAGKPATFLVAAGLVILWAFSGPFFGFNDTWQLAINTTTTIVTFLMVFLIQNTQNRDTTAIQVKLDELIFRMAGADNKVAAADHMSDEELAHLHQSYQQRAEGVLDSLNQRRTDKKAA